MRILRSLLLAITTGILLYSCIQEEALNAECDIEWVNLDDEHIIGEPVIENNLIIFQARPGIDLNSLSPEFTLTPGAKIMPESGTTHDFSTGMTYTVFSEDGNWSKEYEIRFNLMGPKTKYSFENYEIKDGKFCLFYEVNNGERQDWASGNSAFVFSGGGTSTELFPTYYSEDEKEGRSALKLVTSSTGAWGADLKKPIAAGNLFLGTFVTTIALTNPLRATRFGKPYSLQPLRFKGWYKYKPGESFTDKNNTVFYDREDDCDIYAVLYDTSNGNNYLTGENILTSPDIVAIARVEDKVVSDEYVQFNIPFNYLQNFEEEKQNSYKYNLTVVFSSSKTGDIFEGAVGSTLIVDEVELICEE